MTAPTPERWRAAMRRDAEVGRRFSHDDVLRLLDWGEAAEVKAAVQAAKVATLRDAVAVAMAERDALREQVARLADALDYALNGFFEPGRKAEARRVLAEFRVSEGKPHE